MHKNEYKPLNLKISFNFFVILIYLISCLIAITFFPTIEHIVGHTSKKIDKH